MVTACVVRRLGRGMDELLMARKRNATPDAIDARPLIEWMSDLNIDDSTLREYGDLQRLFANKSDVIENRGYFLSFDPNFEKFAPASIKERMREKIIFDPRTGMVPIGQGSELVKYQMDAAAWSGANSQTVVSLGSVNLTRVQQACTSLYLTHPLAKSVINAYTMLTIGEGVTINWTPPDARSKQASRLQMDWNQIERDTRFQQRIRNTIRSVFTLGEGLTVLYPLNRKSNQRATSFRFIEPDRIREIYYNDQDVESVVGYRISGGPGGNDLMLSANDVIHHRIGSIGNIPRGIPILLPVLQMLRYWTLFVENRHWLNMIRCRIPVVRTMKGSSAQLSAERSRLSTLPRPGTIAIDSESAEWKMPSLNIDAAGAADDARLILLGIAAGVGLPEYLVSADAANANYASALVVESPTVRNILDHQESFSYDICRIVTALTGREAGFSPQFPPVVRRNAAEMAQAATALVQNNVWSRRTACEMTGKSWVDEDGELQRIRQEEEDGFVAEPTVSPFNNVDDGGMGPAKKGAALGGASNSADTAKA